MQRYPIVTRSWIWVKAGRFGPFGEMYFLWKYTSNGAPITCLKMLCLYIDTLLISYNICKMVSMLIELVLQTELQHWNKR